MAESVSVDRAVVRAMAEDHWRSFLAVAATSAEIGAASIRRFEERIHATAALMAPGDAATFLKAMQEERNMLVDEYERDPETLKRRLGFAPGVQAHTGQQGIGGMVVRTAVRATVWDAVRALFSAFR